MAFIRSKVPATYKFPVTYTFAGQDLQQDDKLSFTAVFKRMTKKETQELANGAKKTKEEAETMSLANEAMKFMVGWEDVLDEENLPIPFTKEELDNLFEEYPALYVAICEAYADSQFESGRKKQRAMVSNGVKA